MEIHRARARERERDRGGLLKACTSEAGLGYTESAPGSCARAMAEAHMFVFVRVCVCVRVSVCA